MNKILSTRLSLISIFALFGALLNFGEAWGEQLDAAINQQEQRALDYVSVFNAGDPVVYEQYMQRNRATRILQSADAAQRAESFAQLQSMFGTFEVLGAMQPSDIETRLLVTTSAAEETLEIIFSHDVAPDYKVLGINFQPLAEEVAIDENWASLDRLLAQYVSATGIPSWSVGVVRGDKIVALAAAGVASIESDQAVIESKSAYHWGSVSKSLTGTLIGALVEQGKLTWSTTIGEVFNNEQIIAAYRNVTIAQLMAHRSGIPPYEDFEEAFVIALEQRAPGDLVKQRRLWVMDVLTQDEPIFTPGEGHRYSNAGVSVAGVMAELVTGKTWEELVDALVLKPLNMSSAGFGWPATPDKPKQTRGHFGMDTQMLELMSLDDLQSLLVITAPAANIHSTIGDFAKYAQAHLRGMQGKSGVLNASTVQTLHTPLAAEKLRAEPYSYGWGQKTLPDGKTLHWHNGGAGSFYAEIRLIPESDLALVIMANAGVAERMVDPLWQALYARYRLP